jgi:excisionase family DNA binding protein
VPPREASRLLSIGESKLYELLRAGELSSFRIGSARRISTKSILDFVERQTAQAGLAELIRLRGQEPPGTINPAPRTVPGSLTESNG